MALVALATEITRTGRRRVYHSQEGAVTAAGLSGAASRPTTLGRYRR